jgi:ribonuclease-3
MSASLLQLQQRLGYTFRDPALLARALTHPSLANELPELKDANQRLEFLGDAVLQLVLSEEIFHRYPEEREGVLTNLRKKLVEGRFIAELALELALDECLRVQAATPELARNQSALEDAFEALVAAIYLDAGYGPTRETVLHIYGDVAARLEKTLPADNPKGRLQELVQPKHGNNALRYEVTKTSGVAHQRAYHVTVFLLDRELGSGDGTSKKLAEEAAALAALKSLDQGSNS